MNAKSLRTIQRQLAERYMQLDLLRSTGAGVAVATDAASVGSGGSIETLEAEIGVLRKEVLDLIKTPKRELTEEQREAARRQLALPHWFTAELAGMLLPDKSPDDCASLLDLLAGYRDIEEDTNRGGVYRLSTESRVDLINWWEAPEQRADLTGWSRKLADFCARQAGGAIRAEQDPWLSEQLYHLVAAAPADALALLDRLFTRLVDQDFDLGRAERLLRPLEERRELLSDLERSADPPAQWWQTIADRRNDVTARAYWIGEWYKTIPFVDRPALVDKLELIFAPKPDAGAQPGATASQAPVPWLAILHAPGGYGKTALIEWLLARYVLPKGYVCARFDYDLRSADRLREVARNPLSIIQELARCLNDQRTYKGTSLDPRNWTQLRTQGEVDFSRVLQETYGTKTVILFIDTLEELLQETAEPGPHLRELLSLLVRMKQGSGPEPYAGLHVVLSGRTDLLGAYRPIIDEVLGSGPSAYLDVPITGFNREEAEEYLTSKRKLANPKLIQAILDKATDIHKLKSDGTPESTTIVPLKLALYADLVKDSRDITPELIRSEERVDLLYLTKRIIERIHLPDLKWLLRYGVIFRYFDVEAAQVLVRYIEAARRGTGRDDPSLDPELIRLAMSDSRNLGDEPLRPLTELLPQLARYSWVTQREGVIGFHPIIKEPQLRNLHDDQARVWNALQRAAHLHFAERAEASEDLAQKSRYLREAVYHALFLSTGPSYWRKQLKRYEEGPGQLLWPLVDEAFGNDKARAQGRLGNNDAYRAHLAAARVLDAERAQPFLQGADQQLAEAERVALAAVERAPSVAARSRAYRVLARVRLDRDRPAEALEAATKGAQQAQTTRIDAVGKAHALEMLGLCQSANGLAQEALGSYRQAYAALRNRPRDEARLQIALDLAEALYPEDWTEGERVMAEAGEILAAQGDGAEPRVAARYWEVKGRMALLGGRLADAAEAYATGLELPDPEQRARLAAGMAVLKLLQQPAVDAESDNPEVRVAAAAACGDWPGMGAMLRARQQATQKLPANKAVPALNDLFQYYLEVSREWRQARGMQKKAAGWLKRAAAGPELARLRSLNLQATLLLDPAPMNPSAARAEVASRRAEMERLASASRTVEAKAWLMLVRVYGDVDPWNRATKGEEAAASIYRSFAADALGRAMDLLAGNMAPLDQMDIMRTMVALPGWSSSFINRYGLPPGETGVLDILYGLLRQPPEDDGRSRPLLARLAREVTGGIKERLDQLEERIEAARSDSALLYTSYARLLAAFNDSTKLRAALQKLTPGLLADAPLLAILDWAYLLPWNEALPLIDATLARRAVRENAGLRGGVLVAAAALVLRRREPDAPFDRAAGWLADAAEALPKGEAFRHLALDLEVLRAALALTAQTVADAAIPLKAALQLAERIADPASHLAIRDALDEVERRLAQDEDKAPTSRGIEPPAKGAQELVFHFDISAWSSPPREQVTIYAAGLPVEMLDWELDFDYSQLSYRPRWRHPASRGSSELLELDDWRLLLNDYASQPEIPGSALLRTAFPPVALARLESHLQQQDPEEADQASPAVRMVLMGDPRLELVPWGLMYLADRKTWLTAAARFTYGVDASGGKQVLAGTCVVVRPNEQRGRYDYAAIETIDEVVAGYNQATDRVAIIPDEALNPYSPFRAYGDASTGAQRSFEAVKCLHVLGDFRQRDVTEEDVGFEIGIPMETASEFRLSADSLASALMELGIGPCLIVIEQFGTGSLSEDMRALLLRNRFAADLARRADRPVLAAGPRYLRRGRARVQQGYAALLGRIAKADAVTTAELEDWLLQARREILSPESSNPNAPLPAPFEAQIDLFYPPSAVAA